MHIAVKLAVVAALGLSGCQSRPPEFGPKDVALLQKLADDVCLCRRQPVQGPSQSGLASICTSQFDSAIAKVGSEEALSAPDGPLTTRMLYVGPAAKGYDILKSSNRPEPPSIIVERAFNACTAAEESASQRRLEACQKRKGYGPEEDGRCWDEFY